MFPGKFCASKLARACRLLRSRTMGKFAKGSIFNKLVILLPVALLLNHFLPGLLPIILMVGGTYLAFEGAEKVWHKLSGEQDDDKPSVEKGPEAEKKIVSNAIRTDLILSAEIMVIALSAVSHQGFWSQLASLVVVAFFITILVYGVVALLIRMDDLGLKLAQRDSSGMKKLGRSLVTAMPKVLTTISVVGTVANATTSASRTSESLSSSSTLRISSAALSRVEFLAASRLALVVSTCCSRVARRFSSRRVAGDTWSRVKVCGRLLFIVLDARLLGSLHSGRTGNSARHPPGPQQSGRSRTVHSACRVALVEPVRQDELNNPVARNLMVSFRPAQPFQEPPCRPVTNSSS